MGLHVYNFGGRVDAWTSYFTSELCVFTCWKCLDVIKYVIADLRRTKFRIQLMQDPKPVPANFFCTYFTQIESAWCLDQVVEILKMQR